MTKTPFEIRLELLKLAKDIISEDFYNTRQAIETQYHVDMDNWQKNYQIGRTEPHIKFPDIPYTVTQEAVVAMATKLNEFVSNG
jgi:hypothetical protein